MVNFIVKGSLAMAISLMIFANSAMAFGSHSRHGFFDRNSEKHSERMIEHLTEDLELDSVQVAKLRKIKDELNAKRKAMKVDRKQIFETFLNEIANDELDISKFQVIVDNHASRVKLETAFLTEKLVEFHQMLSPVQRELVVDKVKEMRQRREDRKSGWFYKTPEERADSILDMVSDRLALTEDQFIAFTKIKNNLLKSRSTYLNDGYFLRLTDQFSGQFVRETLNTNEIQHEMNDAIARLEKMASVVLKNIKKAHENLSVEQRDQIVEKMQDHSRRVTKK